MTELTAEQIIAEDRQRRAILLAAERERRAEARRREREYHESLPQVRWRPPLVEPGTRYVLTTERVVAYDPVDRRVWVMTPGTWLDQAYARSLGVDGPAVELAWGPA